MKNGILGFGASGILVCLELVFQGVLPSDIYVIDPYFDGGTLGRKWGSINSNTTFLQIQRALEKYPTAQTILKRFAAKYEASHIVPLYQLSEILRESIQPFYGSIHMVQSKCTKVKEKSLDKWLLQLSTGESLEVDRVFLCQGGKVRKEDLGKPLIPLEIAFDKNKLKQYCSPNQCIGILGASHSATLVAKNCVECGARVILFHKHMPVFLFARDGAYDGLKQESADIADDILAKKGIGESIQLIHLDKVTEAMKMITKCQWIIQCIGFESKEIEIVTEDGQQVNSRNYNEQNAEILPNKSIYGFGLAYPGKTTIGEKTYVDVSIPSFVEQIEKCLPAVFTKKQ